MTKYYLSEYILEGKFEKCHFGEVRVITLLALKNVEFRILLLN